MYKNKKMIKQQKDIIKLFDKQIKELEKLMKNLIESDEVVKQKVANICKIKGIGLLSVATVLAETNGFELFKNYKQVVSYAGFDVVERESGMSTGKTKISKKGNSRIRRALFMPSFVAVKHKEKALVDLYERTFAKHGIKMKSYVAVQKKLLVLIYHIWKKNEEYNSDYQNNSPKNEFEAIQDNNLKSSFSKGQIYEKRQENEARNEKKEEIYIHCEVV
jgi:transposase